VVVSGATDSFTAIKGAETAMIGMIKAVSALLIAVKLSRR